MGIYPAGLDRQFLAALFATPGRTVWPGGAVTTVAGTMNVSVAPGTASVPMQTGAGSEVIYWDAAEIVTLPTPPGAGLTRIDLIIAQVRDNALDSGGNNDFIFTSVTGTPAASPVAPSAPVNSLVMAQVSVPGSYTNLNNATVIDQRIPLNQQNLWGRIVQQSIYAFTAAGWIQMTLNGTDFLSPGFVNNANRLQVPIAGRYDLEGVLGSMNVASNGIPAQNNIQVGINAPSGTPSGWICQSANYFNGTYPGLVTTKLRALLPAGCILALQVYISNMYAGLVSDMNSGNVIPCSLTAAYVGP
jgi:hypothetical protein